MNTSFITSDIVETATPRRLLMIAVYCVSYALISKFPHTSNSKMNIQCAAFYSSCNLIHRAYKFSFFHLLNSFRSTFVILINLRLFCFYFFFILFLFFIVFCFSFVLFSVFLFFFSFLQYLCILYFCIPRGFLLVK